MIERRLKAIAVAGAWLALSAIGEPTQGADVVVSTLDGAEQSGRLVALSDDAITVRTTQTEVEFSLALVHWIRFHGEKTAIGEEAGLVELTSGTTLPVAGFTTDGQQCELELAGGLSVAAGHKLAARYGAVAAYVFGRGGPALVEQWRRIRRTRATADLIVVKRRDGQTLDYVEGIVLAVTPDRLSVDLDGDTIDVGRHRVYGVVCFRPDADPSEGNELIRVGARTAELRANRLNWSSGNTLQAELPGLTTIQLPLEDVTTIDFSRGGVLLLSDLTPVAVDWRPAFGAVGDAELAQAWGRMRRDQSYSGGPITLGVQDGKPLHFSKGVAIRSHGDVSFETPTEFGYFRATVGIDPGSLARGAVRLRIEADGRELFDRPFAMRDEPFEVELPVSNVTHLRFVVDGPGGALGDGAMHLGNARFTR